MGTILEPLISKGQSTGEGGFSKALQHVVSSETFETVVKARQLRPEESPSQYRPITTTSSEKVFDAVAAAKVAFAQVAMHMPRQWREQAFAQLDTLHDVTEWENDDQPIAQSSFATFLRTLILLGITSFPSLGMTSEGNILAAWVIDSDRLTMEFLPSNKVQWTVVQVVADEMEPTSGICSVKRLANLLAPHDPARWFSA